MLAKYGLLALALIAAWFVLLRPALASAEKRRKPDSTPPASADLAPCPECGVFRLPGGDCDCTRPPAPRA